MDFQKNYLVPLFALLGLVSALAFLAIAYFLFKQTRLSSAPRSLTWEDCVKDSRSVIMEIYPARCTIAGLGTVTQPISDEDKKKLQPPEDQSCQSDTGECDETRDNQANSR